jgi:hypothetical protein
MLAESPGVEGDRMREASRLVKKRGFWGLNFAAGCFGDGDNCPTLVTYGARGKAIAMVELTTTEPEKKEAVEAALAAGRGLVAAHEGVHSYVLWWDGYLTMNDKRTDAVFCEVGVRGEGSAFVFALRYVVEDGELVKLGRPKLVLQVEPAFEAPVLLLPPWKSGKSQRRRGKSEDVLGRLKGRRTKSASAASRRRTV